MLTFSHLQSLVATSTSLSGPSLYRELYGWTDRASFPLTSWDAWHALPILTKEDIIRVPLHKRLFCSLSEVDHIRATSGTSGRPPLLCPRTHLHGLDQRTQYHDFKGATLSYTVPIMPHWHEDFLRTHGHAPRVVVFDPRRAGASVRLASAMRVDHICLFTFHMPTVSTLFAQQGIGKQVKLIEIAGESCSQALYQQMRTVFPQATILSYYGATEVEDWPIGMACQPLSDEDPLGVYHGKETQYLELIDPDTGKHIESAVGAEGDLLISAFPQEPRAFPLIRYRIGDRVRIVGECATHGLWSFVVLGRAESDFLKVPGGLLRADEVERVLRSLGGRVSDTFKLHRYDRATVNGVQIEVVLSIEPRAGESLEELARLISTRLRVSPVRTYADGVREGMYRPLVCRLFEKTEELQKHKRMVHHTQ